VTTPEETREQRLARLRDMINRKVGQTATVTQGQATQQPATVTQGQATQQLDDFGEVTVDPALYADSRAKPVIRPGELPVVTGPTPRPIEIASIPEDQLPLEKKMSDEDFFSGRMRK